MKQWYVLQVVSGREEWARDDLQELGFRAIVPVENRMIRHGGQWIWRKYVLFPGYLFVQSALTPEEYYRMRGVPGILGLLRTGSAPSPLTDEEAARVLILGGAVLDPSLLSFEPDGYRVLEGPLLDLEHQIVRVDRHRRRATIRVGIPGLETLELSFMEIKC